jgi:hypothetical protein
MLTFLWLLSLPVFLCLPWLRESAVFPSVDIFYTVTLYPHFNLCSTGNLFQPFLNTIVHVRLVFSNSRDITCVLELPPQFLQKHANHAPQYTASFSSRQLNPFCNLVSPSMDSLKFMYILQAKSGSNYKCAHVSSPHIPANHLAIKSFQLSDLRQCSQNICRQRNICKL